MAKVLFDVTVLVEGERQHFDLAQWALDGGHEVLICDAGVAEFLAGRPLKDAGKEKRWLRYFEEFVSVLPSVGLDRAVCETAGDLLAGARRHGKTVPLGDGLHAAAATLEAAIVATTDKEHFSQLGVKNFNPLLEDPPA